eukprot:IDg13479t1
MSSQLTDLGTNNQIKKSHAACAFPACAPRSAFFSPKFRRISELIGFGRGTFCLAECPPRETLDGLQNRLLVTAHSARAFLPTSFGDLCAYLFDF